MGLMLTVLSYIAGFVLSKTLSDPFCLMSLSSGSLVFYNLYPTLCRHLSRQLRLRTPKLIFLPSDTDYQAFPWAEVCLTWLPLGTYALGWIQPSLSNPSATSLQTASSAISLLPSHLFPPLHLPCKWRVWSPASLPSTYPGTSSSSPSSSSPGSCPVATTCSYPH